MSNSSLPTTGRLLALDYGTHKIGIAVSDPGQLIVFPRYTWKNDDDFVDKLKEVIEEDQVVGILVGLPLDFYGAENNWTHMVRNFSVRLGEELGIPVRLQDEKLTTFDAKEKLRMAMDQRQVVADKDQLAAYVILEEYLAN